MSLPDSASAAPARAALLHFIRHHIPEPNSTTAEGDAFLDRVLELSINILHAPTSSQRQSKRPRPCSTSDDHAPDSATTGPQSFVDAKNASPAVATVTTEDAVTGGVCSTKPTTVEDVVYIQEIHEEGSGIARVVPVKDLPGGLARLTKEYHHTWIPVYGDEAEGEVTPEQRYVSAINDKTRHVIQCQKPDMYIVPPHERITACCAVYTWK